MVQRMQKYNVNFDTYKHMYKTNTDISFKNIPKWQFKQMPETVWFEYGESMEYIAGPHTSCGRVFFPLKLFIIFKIFQ